MPIWCGMITSMGNVICFDFMSIKANQVWGVAMARSHLILITMLFGWLLMPSASAAEFEGANQINDDLSLLFEEDELFISATQSARTLGKAPAIATVITDHQLENMGARNIFDALVTVPGFGYSYLNTISTESDIEVRGIKSRMDKVLLMIDGHRINNPFQGSFSHLFDEFPIEQIKRIEVIRGPGSALYGANAFVGVINIIMKKPGDFKGVKLKAGGGNNSRRHGNLLLGQGDADGGVVASYDRLDTDGSRQFVASDALGNSGYTNFWRSTDTAHLIASMDKFSFSALYLDKRRGTPLSITNMIDTRTRTNNRQAYGNIQYRDRLGSVDVEARVGVDQFEWDTEWQINLPGFTTGHPLLKNRTYSGELRLQFEPLQSHHLTMGVSQEFQRQFDVHHIVNGADVSNVFNHNKPAKRQVSAVYLQDEWEIRDDLILTAGVRFDHYSDFGNTTNPRLALVWSANDNLDIKLLYATAFRAPSFIEMYEINNPASVGNPNLIPEKMQTFEAGLVWKLTHNYQLSANLFHNRFTERIVPTTPLTINSGGATIWGGEVELKADWQEYLYGYLNYSYQKSKDNQTQLILPNVPQHRIRVGANAGLFDDWVNINAALRWDGKRGRGAGDTRAAMPATTVVDLGVSTERLMKGLTLSFKAHNLFNTKNYDPSPVTVANGYPRPGRTLLAEAEYKF
ncbi:TonB-dependent receptor [Mariprofundus sp. NF]|nr:TonB-dependent receptor [Mariprofundus sp. NF]